MYIPGDTEHAMRSAHGDEVVWLYVFAVDGFGEVVYRFSTADEDKKKKKKEGKAKL